MPSISCACHQFPPVVIQHAARLDLRFTLSHRDVENLPAERGLEVRHETVRRWVLKFGPAVARRLRRAPAAAGAAFPPAHRLRQPSPSFALGGLRCLQAIDVARLAARKTGLWC
jgi:hypothetical protein